ncbi:MAG: M23 family metallopeptidase, partial [Mycobacteriaceae bacterium]
MIHRWALLVCCGAALSLLSATVMSVGHAGANTPEVTQSASGSDPIPRGDYNWPLAGSPRVGRPFQPPLSTYGPGHRGVDLVASTGASVLAAGGGTVIFAGELAGRGVVSVLHANGLQTTYEPVTPQVTQGEVVRRGQVLGELQAGHAGCPEAACLHWGL